MEKCFVTKLKAATNNSKLLRIGELRIGVSRVASPSENTQGFGFAFSKDTQLEIIGDGYFTDSTLTQNKGKVITVPAYNSISDITDVYVSNGDFEVAVLDKYALTSLIFFTTGHTNSSIVTNRTFDIDSLKYSSNLFRVNLKNANAYGDIDVFKNKTSLNNVSINSNKVYGDIACLSNLTDLSQVNLSSCEISGDIKVLNSSKKIQVVNFYNTDVYGDINVFANKTSLVSCNLMTTKATGDISVFSNKASLNDFSVMNCSGNIDSLQNDVKLYSFDSKSSLLSGDLAKLPESCYFANFQDDKGSVFSWSSRNTSAYVLGMYGNHNISNIDKMLQDNAQCAAKNGLSALQKTIMCAGNRTSASDAAVQTLQSKGYTVSITPAQ